MLNEFVVTVHEVGLPQGSRFQVDRLIAEATYPQIYGGYCRHPDDLFFPAEEIDTFIDLHASKLNVAGNSNFFLTERVGGIYVVHVHILGGFCEVHEEEISSSSRVWRPELDHRIVVPKIN